MWPAGHCMDSINLKGQRHVGRVEIIWVWPELVPEKSHGLRRWGWEAKYGSGGRSSWHRKNQDVTRFPKSQWSLWLIWDWTQISCAVVPRATHPLSDLLFTAGKSDLGINLNLESRLWKYGWERRETRRLRGTYSLYILIFKSKFPVLCSDFIPLFIYHFLQLLHDLSLSLWHSWLKKEQRKQTKDNQELLRLRTITVRNI